MVHLYTILYIERIWNESGYDRTRAHQPLQETKTHQSLASFPGTARSIAINTSSCDYNNTLSSWAVQLPVINNQIMATQRIYIACLPVHTLLVSASTVALQLRYRSHRGKFRILHIHLHRVGCQPLTPLGIEMEAPCSGSLDIPLQHTSARGLA